MRDCRADDHLPWCLRTISGLLPFRGFRNQASGYQEPGFGLQERKFGVSGTGYQKILTRSTGLATFSTGVTLLSTESNAYNTGQRNRYSGFGSQAAILFLIGRSLKRKPRYRMVDRPAQFVFGR